MPTTNPLIQAPTDGSLASMGNPLIVPKGVPIGAQTIAGVQVNPQAIETQTAALAAIMQQQLAGQQQIADAMEAERLRLTRPDFSNVIGGVESSETSNAPKAPVTAGPDGGWAQMFGDALLGVASGIPALIEMGGALGGLATGNIDNAVTQAGRSGREWVQERQSDELKADRAARAERVAAAEGEVAKAAEYITSSVGDISLFIDAIASNIATAGPAGIAGRLVGRGVAKSAARKTAERVAAGTVGKESAARAAQLIGRRAGMRTAVGVGAVQQGMDVASDVYYDSIADTDWEQNPDFITRVAAGDDPDDVKHEMSMDAARLAAPAAIALSAASQMLPGGREIEKLFVGRTARDALRKSGFWARVGGASRGALGEAAQEAVEEGGGATIGNFAQNVLAAPVALGEGVGEATGAGVVGGLGLGGIAGATRSGPRPARAPAPSGAVPGTAPGLPQAPGAAPAAPGAPAAPAAVPGAPAAPAAAAAAVDTTTPPPDPTEEEAPLSVPRGVAAMPAAERGQAAQRAARIVIATNKALKAAGIKEYDENGQLTDRDLQITVEDFLADPNGTAEDVQATGIEGKALQALNAAALDLNNRVAPREIEMEMRYALTPEVAARLKQLSNKQLDKWAEFAGGMTTDADGNESPRWRGMDLLRMISRGEVRPNNALPADVRAQVEAGFAAVPIGGLFPVARAPLAADAEDAATTAAPAGPGLFDEQEALQAAQALAVSGGIPAMSSGRNPLANPGPDPLALERNNNEIMRTTRAQIRRSRMPVEAGPTNPLAASTVSAGPTSTFGELRDDAIAALDLMAASPTVALMGRALVASRRAAEAAPAGQAKTFWTNMASDLQADIADASTPPATATRSQAPPKTEAAPAAAEGRQSPASAASAPASTAPRDESPAMRRMRERRERAQSPTVPRISTTTSARADNAAINTQDAAQAQLFDYDGVRTLPGQPIDHAYANHTGNGSEYMVHFPGQTPFLVADAQEVRNVFKAANYSIYDRSTTGFTDLPGNLIRPTMEQKASAPIRGAARMIRIAASPFGAERANNLANGFLESMASTAAALMSRYTFVDQMSAGLEATTGENTRLGRAFRNALQRARSVGTRISSPMFQMRDQIGQFLRDVGSNEAEFGDYVYALTALERNARLRGKQIPGTDLVTSDNAAAFEWTSPSGERLTGDAAANALIQSLPRDKRQAFEAAYAVTRQMVQDALGLQLQLGMMSEETYLNLGGRYHDGSQKEGSYRNWAPLLNEGQETFSTMETPEGRYTKAANPYVNLLRETSRMQRSAIMNRPWQEAYAWMVKHPDPSFATLNAQDAKPDKDELVWRRSDIANERTVWVFFNGERRSITFNDKLAIDFIKHSRDTERHVVMNAMRTGIQWMSGFRTAWNVAFVLGATAWDALMLGSSVQSAAAGTLTKEEASLVTQKAFGHLLSSLKTITATVTTRKSDDAYYTVYETNGGGIAFGDRQAYGDVLDRVRQSAGSGNQLIGAVKRTGVTYSDLLHAPEAMFRFSVFKAYIEQKAGHSFESADQLRAWGREHQNEFEQALEMSRLITADFSDAGLSGGPRSLYMFFNAAMQGTRSLARLPNSERGRQALTIMLMTGAAAALIGAGDEDDEDVDGGSRYARLKGRGRQIQFGEGFAVPLAPEMRMAYTLGNSMALMAMGKISEGKAAMDFGRSVVDTISPLRVPETDMPSEALLFILAPSLSHPVITALAGIDGFGRDTETEEDRTFAYDKTGKRVKVENPANYERGRDRDPQWSKDWARKIHDASGIDLFPGRIAEVGRTLFGGVYSFIDKLESDGPAEATFRGFKTEYDEFAVRHEYEKTREDAALEIRRLQTNVNPLAAASPERTAALRELTRAQKLLKNVRVNGYDENSLYKMQRTAEASGDEAQIVAAEGLMEQLRAEKARIMGAALAAVRGQGEEL